MRFFENFLKFYRNFRENSGKKFRKFWKYGFVVGWGRSPPKQAKILKKISPKINGKLQNLETFHEILANFDLKKLILIKIKTILIEF